MLEPFSWLLLLTGLVGFGLAGYWDLKTTEFPDWLPYSMMGVAIAVRGAYALIYGAWDQLYLSLGVGIAMLALGLLFYYTRQWGDGDAWLMGAFGFLFPDRAGFAPVIADSMPFPLEVLFNFFILSLVYLMVYSLLLGLRDRRVFPAFRKAIGEKARFIAGSVALSLAATGAMGIHAYNAFGVFPDAWLVLSLPLSMLVMLTFLCYARTVETVSFRKHVKYSELRVGDVLISDRWRGLTEAEVKRLRKKKGKAWIKEGVRFAPIFLITMLVTLFVGGMIGVLF